MNILLIERYSKLIQDVIQHTDDILRQLVVDDELRQDIKNQWYTASPDKGRADDDTDWEAIVKAEAENYAFDPSIYPDNFFNE